MRETKRCRSCGAEFKRSRHDTTVNCPDCRRSRRSRSASQTDVALEAALAEAKSRGYAARRAGDDEAYQAAVRDLESLRARRA